MDNRQTSYQRCGTAPIQKPTQLRKSVWKFAFWQRIPIVCRKGKLSSRQICATRYCSLETFNVPDDHRLSRHPGCEKNSFPKEILPMTWSSQMGTNSNEALLYLYKNWSNSKKPKSRYQWEMGRRESLSVSHCTHWPKTTSQPSDWRQGPLIGNNRCIFAFHSSVHSKNEWSFLHYWGPSRLFLIPPRGFHMTEELFSWVLISQFFSWNLAKLLFLEQIGPLHSGEREISSIEQSFEQIFPLLFIGSKKYLRQLGMSNCFCSQYTFYFYHWNNNERSCIRS